MPEDLSKKLSIALKNEKLAKVFIKTAIVWKNLKMTCKDVSLFLGYVIAQIEITDKNKKSSIRLCTGNKNLINSVIKADGGKIKERQSFSNRISQFNEKTGNLTTWDIEEEKYLTVNIKTLKFKNFIGIIPENIDLLNSIMANIK